MRWLQIKNVSCKNRNTTAVRKCVNSPIVYSLSCLKLKFSEVTQPTVTLYVRKIAQYVTTGSLMIEGYHLSYLSYLSFLLFTIYFMNLWARSSIIYPCSKLWRIAMMMVMHNGVVCRSSSLATGTVIWVGVEVLSYFILVYNPNNNGGWFSR